MAKIRSAMAATPKRSRSATLSPKAIIPAMFCEPPSYRSAESFSFSSMREKSRA